MASIGYDIYRQKRAVLDGITGLVQARGGPVSRGPHTFQDVCEFFKNEFDVESRAVPPWFNSHIAEPIIANALADQLDRAPATLQGWQTYLPPDLDPLQLAQKTESLCSYALEVIVDPMPHVLVNVDTTMINQIVEGENLIQVGAVAYTNGTNLHVDGSAPEAVLSDYVDARRPDIVQLDPVGCLLPPRESMPMVHMRQQFLADPNNTDREVHIYQNVQQILTDRERP